MKIILNKVNKTIGLLHRLQNILPRSAMLTIYKTFIRPQLDYGDIIYDQTYNASFHQKLELLQYNACLTITGAIEVFQMKNYIKNYNPGQNIWNRTEKSSETEQGKKFLISTFAWFLIAIAQV